MRANAWYEAILTQLRAAEGSLTLAQIWHGMEASGFQHASVMPRSTLGARLTELVKEKKIARLSRSPSEGHTLYRLAGAAS